MRTSKYLFTLPLLGALALMSACDDAGKKKSPSTPPPQAVAPTLQTQRAPSSPQPKIQETLTPKQDPVDGIIDRAEAEYQRGQANYQAGHLEAAKDNFDRAFNILLQGPVEVHADENLEREFDKIVEAVNGLEMLALKQGDGFTEQRAEPAPIDEANEVTFPVDPAVKAKAEAELRQTRSDLPLVINDQVASFINYFSTKGHGTIERALARSGRYREMIQRIFKEEGVPQDLIYLAQAESGFHPLALSHAGARGMWQFMASRASGYGLERNWWVDDRQDPEKATRAAARHLKDLHNQFGDWYLAMAAYNSGPGNVQKAVQRTGYADFWELYKRNVLPGETRNYVPIILAMTIMAKNPAQYGLEHVVPDAPFKTDTVRINYPVDLRLVAECVDSSVSNLQELNPSLLRMTTPKEGSFDLHLPLDTTERFQQQIAAIPLDKRVLWRFHKVQSGESLADVARKYRTTTASIAEVNNIGADDTLKKDAKLVIPVQAGRVRAEGETVAFSKRPIHYKVRKGDTLLSVADDYGVPVERLRKWNHLKGTALRPGRTLTIYRPVAGGDSEVASREPRKSGKKTASSKGKARGRVEADEDEPVRTSARKSSKSNKLERASKGRAHKVRRGETLAGIAAEYNTTVQALRRDNGKLAKNLKPGQVLLIK